ncbi:hypothetical protein [Limosilactobacillus vaginalis]|uniref:hypothetical protein n=1 Tax=Limosilactobacillus vaginalis TaxID=1633 RepID=UPI003AABCD01
MINEVLHSRLIAFVMGSWSVYCGSIGAYDGATFILLFYGLMLLLNHLDRKKSDSAANTDAQNK